MTLVTFIMAGRVMKQDEGSKATCPSRGKARLVRATANKISFMFCLAPFPRICAYGKEKYAAPHTGLSAPGPRCPVPPRSLCMFLVCPVLPSLRLTRWLGGPRHPRQPCSSSPGRPLRATSGRKPQGSPTPGGTCVRSMAPKHSTATTTPGKARFRANVCPLLLGTVSSYSFKFN